MSLDEALELNARLNARLSSPPVAGSPLRPSPPSGGTPPPTFPSLSPAPPPPIPPHPSLIPAPSSPARSSPTTTGLGGPTGVSPPRPSAAASLRASGSTRIPLPPTFSGSGTGSDKPASRRTSLPGVAAAASASAAAGPTGAAFSSFSSASLPAPAISRLSVEGTDDIDERLPLEVQVRLLRAALRIARADSAEASTSASTAHTQLLDLNKAASAAASERVLLQRAVKAAEDALAKAKKAASSAEVREAEARAEVESVRREAKEAAGRERPTRGGEGEAVRLARALEDNEKLRASLAQERALGSEVAGAHRREVETLQGVARKAEKQRAELLAAFRKQAKLVEILKRQRVHMEAARALDFVEKEFLEAIGEGGSKVK